MPSVINFKEVEWGPDEAKNDDKLQSYFVDIPGYDEIVSGAKRFVIGRKGTGKTAICKRIKICAANDPLWHSSDLSLKSFPMQLIKEMRDNSYVDKSQYVAIWTFLILVEFAKLVVGDNGVNGGKGSPILKDFLTINFPGNEYGMSKTLQVLHSKNKKVSVEARCLGAEFTKGGAETRIIEVDYNKVNTWLEKVLKTTFTESHYFVLMDELDEGFKSNNSALRLLLLSLIRATENVALSLSERGVAFRPVLVLRSDIFDSLEDNDLNKLDDYILRLKWFSDPGEGNCLLDIVNARIINSIQTPAYSVPWNQVVDESKGQLPKGIQSVWAYINARTFQRPRDVIKYLKKCKEIVNQGRLTFENVRDAESSYSDWFYGELRDEIQAHLPIWKEALGCIQKIGQGRFSVSKLIGVMENDEDVVKYVSGGQKSYLKIVELLFQFGVVGTVDQQKRWLFTYKDADTAFDPNTDLIVHYGFQKKLKIFSYFKKGTGRFKKKVNKK